jgi:hypothetical protein
METPRVKWDKETTAPAFQIDDGMFFTSKFGDHGAIENDS